MLGWEFNTTGLIVPKRRAGFDRLIVVANTTLTNSCVFEACKASFPSWRYWNDLDSGVLENERDPKNGTYAVWFRDKIEADEGLKDKSACDIRAMDLKTITLLERQLFELVYFMETGRHLDIENWTLCSGSRDLGGHVPGTNGDYDRFRVGYGFPEEHDPSLRSREAVSL